MARVASVRFTGFLLIVLFSALILGPPLVAAQEEAKNIGALKVHTVQYPAQVAPSAQFSLTIDVEYAIRLNATVKSALFEGSQSNLGPELWHSDNTVLAGGGDRVWRVNLTAPSTERAVWTLTAFAYYLENATWQYFTDDYRGPGFAEITIKVANLATLEIYLGAPNLPVQVDSYAGKTSSVGKFSLALPVGVAHTITVPQVRDLENGTRLVFAGWQDGNNDTRRTLTLDGDTRMVGSYITQYLLRVNSLVPDYSRSVWYDAGANVSLSVEGSLPMPNLLGSLGLRYVFRGWSGDIESSSTSVNLIMNQPKTESADFTVDLASLIIPMILVIGIVGGFLLAMSRRSRRKTVPVEEQAAGEVAQMFCDGCGEPVEKDWVHCTHCGRELHFPEPVQGRERHVPDFRDEAVGDDDKKRD